MKNGNTSSPPPPSPRRARSEAARWLVFVPAVTAAVLVSVAVANRVFGALDRDAIDAWLWALIALMLLPGLATGLLLMYVGARVLAARSSGLSTSRTFGVLFQSDVTGRKVERWLFVVPSLGVLALRACDATWEVVAAGAAAWHCRSPWWAAPPLADMPGVHVRICWLESLWPVAALAATVAFLSSVWIARRRAGQ